MAYGKDDIYGAPANETPNTTMAPSATPPSGFVLDPATGLYLGPGGNLSWDPKTGQIGYPHGPTQPPLTAPTVPPITGGGGGSGGGGGNGLPSPFTSTFNAPAPINLGGPAGIPFIPPTPTFAPPTYTKPPAFQYQPFTAPTASDVLADPSYTFRRDQGLGAISNNEAARGLWASGQTGKAFNDYASNFASQEYGNIYNRNLNSYLTNFNNALTSYATNAQTQFNTPYQNAYQSAKDQFAPQLTGYQTQAAAGQRQNEFNYSNAYQKWLDDFSQKYTTGRFLFDASNA